MSILPSYYLFVCRRCHHLRNRDLVYTFPDQNFFKERNRMGQEFFVNVLKVNKSLHCMHSITVIHVLHLLQQFGTMVAVVIPIPLHWHTQEDVRALDTILFNDKIHISILSLLCLYIISLQLVVCRHLHVHH